MTATKTRLSKTSSHSFDIAASAEKIGQLTPVLRDKFGNVIDGNHRLVIDPQWRSITDDSIDTEEKLILAQFHANWHRRTSEDIKQAVNKLLALYSVQKSLDDSGSSFQKLEGRQQNELLHRVADALSVSYKTVSNYAPSEFKQKTPVKTKSMKQRFTNKSSKQETIIETPKISLTFPKCLCKGCEHVNVCSKRT